MLFVPGQVLIGEGGKEGGVNVGVGDSKQAQAIIAGLALFLDTEGGPVSEF
jgi:hypothetical protein